MNRWRTLQMGLLWRGARDLGRRSALLGGWFASVLWFLPWPTRSTPSSVARETEWLAPTSRLELDVEGVRLRGFSAGEGPLVLLVHGWGDHAARMGAFIAPLVAAGFRVVGLDHPGHGAGRMRATDIPTMAGVLRGAAAKLGPVHAIVGHSLGGTVSMIATRDGLVPRALVLLAPPARLARAVDRFAELLALPEPAVRGLRRRIERRFGVTVWDDYAADHLQLEVPTLIFHDVDDPQVDISESRMMASAWPNARLVETAGLGHERIVRDPEVVGAAVEFVRVGLPSQVRPSVGAQRP